MVEGKVVCVCLSVCVREGKCMQWIVVVTVCMCVCVCVVRCVYGRSYYYTHAKRTLTKSS